MKQISNESIFDLLKRTGFIENGSHPGDRGISRLAKFLGRDRRTIQRRRTIGFSEAERKLLLLMDAMKITPEEVDRLIAGSFNGADRSIIQRKEAASLHR